MGMKYRRLGKDGAEVSVIGLGTWQFGGEWGQDYTQAEVDAVVEACRETGINLIDTAECYGDGVSERLVGQAVARDREKWYIATKFGHRYVGLTEREQLWSAVEVKRQLDTSLKHLRTDYIDLYQFHSGGNAVFENAALWELLAGEVASGRIRAVGVSLTSDAAVRDYQAPHVGAVGATAVQVVYSRLDSGAEAVVFPACRKDGLGVLARVPLASGFLAGKYAKGVEFPANDYRQKWGREKLDAMAERAARVIDEEVPKGVAPVAWALAWCLRHPAVSCVIPGARDVKQLRGNAAAADLVEA